MCSSDLKIAAKCAIEPKSAVPERTGRSVDELRVELNAIKNTSKLEVFSYEYR